MTELAQAKDAQILPVDSEHSALFQLIGAERPGTVERLTLTASGGPFRGRDRGQLEGVTVSEALAGFFRSTAEQARKRAEIAHEAATQASAVPPQTPTAMPAPPVEPPVEPPALSVPLAADDRTDVDWINESSR